MSPLQLVRHFVSQNVTSAVSRPALRDIPSRAWGNRTHKILRRSTDLEVGGTADLAFSERGPAAAPELSPFAPAEYDCACSI